MCEPPWENRVGGACGQGVVAHYSLHHMKPPFHGWLTWWKVIGGPGKWWSDMANNFHYVSVTLSHSLIIFLLAVICHYVSDHRRTPQVISPRWLHHGMDHIARKELTIKYCWYASLWWALVVEITISSCSHRLIYLSLAQLLFIDHSFFADASLSFSLPHRAVRCFSFLKYCISSFYHIV